MSEPREPRNLRPPRDPYRFDKYLMPLAGVLALGSAIMVILALTR